MEQVVHVTVVPSSGSCQTSAWCLLCGCDIVAQLLHVLGNNVELDGYKTLRTHSGYCKNRNMPSLSILHHDTGASSVGSFNCLPSLPSP